MPRPLRPELAPGFDGFQRGCGRGCGTRNYLVLLCVSSRANAFARQLEKRLADAKATPHLGGPSTFDGGHGNFDGAHSTFDGGHSTFDGVVALPHTEDGAAGGGGAARNLALLVRTLTGWLLHPNVGGCLVLQTEEDVAAAAAGRGLCYSTLKDEADRSGRAAQLASLPHAALSLRLRDFGAEPRLLL